MGSFRRKRNGVETMKTLLIYYTDNNGIRRIKRRSSSNDKTLQNFLNSFLRRETAINIDVYLQLDLFEQSG